MRTLTDRENRLVRFAVAGVVIYLALFYGRAFLEKKRTEYQKLVTEARTLKQQLKPYEDRMLVVKKLMENYHMDPAKLKKITVVADASAAIQKSAKTGGLQLGPIRESSARSSAKGLTTVQLEGSGQVPAVLAFLNGLDTIGFPVIVDTVQFTSDSSRPGQVKLSLTLIILDFEQWKSAEASMRERAGQILKFACMILAAFVVYRVAGTLFRMNPLRGAVVPALPALASSTNSPATNLITSATATKGTNSTQRSTGTNAAPAKVAGTNSIPQKSSVENGTNVLISAAATGTNATQSVTTTNTNPVALQNVVKQGTNAVADPVKTETNVVMNLETNATSGATIDIGTNLLIAATTETNGTLSFTVTDTNSVSLQIPADIGTNLVTTNLLVAATTESNATMSVTIVGTNSLSLAVPPAKGTNLLGTNVLASATSAGTNAAAGSKSSKKSTNAVSSSAMEMAGMNPGSSMMPGKRADLSPAVQARISKIVESEILGPVVRPQPMALLGLAGDFAFLRSPSGQTGIVKEGDSLGEIKLLQIGINRVLVEQDGKKQELMIFSGYGSESLLSKEKESPNETNNPSSH